MIWVLRKVIGTSNNPIYLLMKQIQTPNEVLFKTLGYQKPASVNNLRLLVYSLLLPVDKGYLIFNSLTCEMVLLTPEEEKQLYTSEYLYQHWFLVPENFNDIKFAKQCRELFKLFSPTNKVVNSYTILTTTDCNARCFYCYEKGIARIPMTLSVAEKLSDYIISNHQKSLSFNKDCMVNLHWFGGEPLYNRQVIYAICQRLTDAGVPFKSHMVSNGYLFDEQLVTDAKNLWNLKDVQITLDGTEKVYNRAKAYIHEGVNAYERVLHNIDLLLQAHIRVIVRMNIDMHNADDLLKLTEILAERFGHSKGFSCYSHPLFELAGETAHVRSEERREEVYQKQRELINLLEEKNLRRYGSAPKRIATNYCMADSDNSIIVTPSGNIGLCEHFSESEFISHIDNPEVKDKGVINSFHETCEDLDICTDCAFYPQCVRLKKCPEGSLCFKQIKEQHIYELKKSMLVTYDRWKKKQSETVVIDNDDNEDIIINC